ncbi:MAG: serine/threonine-protein kinase [Myxococcota bacterium]|nr:serine/threonine-protein kinase [Myxococcota bacterium]
MRLPQVIGPWRLLERLGHGAFGSVYLAEVAGDEGFTSRVAVKILDPGALDQNPSVGQSLIDEAKLLSYLQHPNIVRVLQLQRISHEFLGETWAMAMEYVEGLTLALLLEAVGLQAKSVKVEGVISLLAEVAGALEYAHNHQGQDGTQLLIVHRDLKPANLIITPEGHVKILDFGIAWATERGVDATREGMTKGTLPYMSPEQVHGLPVDGRSDLYSLGTIVFEMLVGEPFVGFYPFGQSDIGRMVKRVAELHFEQRRDLLRDTLQRHPHHLGERESRSLEHLLARLLAREPVERFQTAAELREAVEELYGFWRPEVGRRQLGSMVGDWYRERPKPGADATLPFLPQQSNPEAIFLADPGSDTPASSARLEDGQVGDVAARPGPLDESGSSRGAPREDGGLEAATQPLPAATEQHAEPTEAASLPGKGKPARRRRRRRASRAEHRASNRRFVLSLAAMALLGLGILVLALQSGLLQTPSWGDAGTSSRQPTSGQRIADVRLVRERGATGASTTVQFVNDRGTTVLAPVLSGLRPTDGLALIRGDGNWIRWALVGTRAFKDNRGVLVLFDLRGEEPREHWRLDTFFEETPELPMGIHGATAYGFGDVDFLLSESTDPSAVPAVVAVAHDRNFAPSWLLRINDRGEVIGRRYHPGHLETLFSLSGDSVVVSGVNNRLCPAGRVPCSQEEVVWVVRPPDPGEKTEFLPACGGGPTRPGGQGYSWSKDRYRIVSVNPNFTEPGGFELLLERRKRGSKAACTSRLSFGHSGDFQGQYSECGFRAPVSAINPDAGVICKQWLDLSRERSD